MSTHKPSDQAATHTFQPDREAATPSNHGSAYFLIIEERAARRFELPESGQLTIGREERPGVETILIQHASISRQHARITITPAGVVLEDLKSHNGTQVNGERLHKPRALLSGDVVSIGSIHLALYRQSAPAQRAAVGEAGSIQQRMDEDLARARRFGHSLAVVCLELAAASVDRAQLGILLRDKLRLIDFAAWRSPSQLVMLLPDLDRDEVREHVGSLLTALGPAAGSVRTAFSLFPADGGDREALLSAAEHAARRAQPGILSDVSQAATVHEVGEHRILVADAAMVRVYERVFQLAEDDLPVLVQGETGSGKELVAAALHYASSRRSGPYVAQNCAGLPDGMVDAVLFGHERGAFTDAKEAQPGLFERADGGTLFLDEIGEMSLGTQAKLLRVLEDRKSARIGSKHPPREHRFRLVAATNRDLRIAVREGRFRQDLYQRINCATIFLKPLRERPSELTQLAEEFLRRECQRRGRPVPRIANPVYEWLHSYSWPGNVRELRNLMTYLSATVRESAIELWHLPEHLSEPVATAAEAATATDGAMSVQPTSVTTAQPQTAVKGVIRADFLPVAQELRELEKRRMQEALAATGGVINQAARLLQMPERTFFKRMKEYCLAVPEQGRL